MKARRVTNWPALAFAIRLKSTNENSHLVTEAPVRLSEPSLLRAAVASLPNENFQSTANRTQELDMENCNPFILNRQVEAKQSEQIALLLVTISLTLSVFAFVLPILSFLIGSGE